MADINWEPFISTRAHKASQALPQITISKDNGRISLNATACELIPGFYSLKYAEVYCGSIENLRKYDYNSQMIKHLRVSLSLERNTREHLQTEPSYTLNH